MKRTTLFSLSIVVAFLFSPAFTPEEADAISEAFKENIYKVGTLKPVDSVLKVKVGGAAPEFTLPAEPF
jgi:peroxiredoxin (alkyl hydroperoxide reductase subunit C)